MKKVSSSNTKAQILEAYEETLKSLREERNQNVALQRELSKQKRVVEKAKSKSGAAQNVKVLRETFNTQLDQIEEALSNEQLNFKELQEAIAVEKKHLEKLYKLKVEADSLDALVLTHKQTKEKLAKQSAQDQEKLAEEVKRQKKEWEQEKEAYKYQLKIKRRNEEDSYQQEKAKLHKELEEKRISFEKEIAEREQSIAGKEEAWNQLQSEAGKFQERLQQAKQETEKEVTQRVTKDLEYKYHIQTKDLEADLKLTRQEIDILKTKIADQDALINALQKKLDSAGLQVKDIALKAIENAGIKSITLPTERKREEE